MSTLRLLRAAAAVCDACRVAEDLAPELRDSADDAASQINVLANALRAVEHDLVKHIEGDEDKENPPR